MRRNNEEINVTDKKYSLESMRPNTEAWFDLWSMNITTYKYMADFWRPCLSTGKKCMEYARRKIFTAEQLKEYSKVKKIPIQPQEMKNVINILSKEIIALVQSSYITTEDSTPPENAMSAEDGAVVLQWLKEQIHYDSERNDLLWDGLLTGYPQWLEFEKREVLGDISEELTASHLPWDSTLCSPHFKKAEDIDELIKVSFRTKAELLDIYPDRAKDHKTHESILSEDPGFYKELLQQDGAYDASDRSDIMFDIMNSATFDAPQGYYTVIERFFPVKKKQKVYISEEKLDSQIMPPDWSERRINTWMRLNPSYDTIKYTEAKTLWVNTISSDGFIWENDRHWFQMDGKLPGKVFIPSMVDKMPTGVGEDMLPYVLAIAVSDTEGLSQVRMGAGSTDYIMEGSLKYPSKYKGQASADRGAIIIKKNAPAGLASVKTVNRNPNTTFFDYGANQRGQLKNVHNINDSMSGVTHSRQSDVSKQREINQGLGSQAPYVKSFSDFDLACTQRLVELFPYVLTEERIVMIKDEFGNNQKEVEINKQDISQVDGVATIIANDLITAKYRIVPVHGEDTETSRKRALEEFVELLEAVGNTLFNINPKLLSNILLSIPNRYAKEAGQFLVEYSGEADQAQQQSAQMEQQTEMQKEKLRRTMDLLKINTPKVAFKLDSKDIAEAPMGAKVMMEIMEQTQQKQKDVLAGLETNQQ